MTPSELKSLILIVAYNAEAHLESVFRRIPYDRLPPNCEILVSDDASLDATYELGRKAALSCPIPTRVLKNPKNLGYGGNQKLGYQLAIQENYQAVVMLHGDGQYAPELLPEMLEPILEGNADVVLGSRMLRKKDALAGGMPLYKWIGNQVLTKLENFIVGGNLSEFHTGYRAYRIDALQRIPFHHNTNNFHFDTDILIQMLRVGAVFREIPIPTFYGNEVCHVDGWKYFFGCLRSCIQDWMTQKGVFYCRRFDLVPPDCRYESKLGIKHSSQSIALGLVPEGSRVLDIGGGRGWLADALTKTKKCSVTILDDEFQQQSDIRHACICNDFKNSKSLDFDIPKVDCILLLDVIEHLPRKQHAALLDKLRGAMDDPPAKVIISVPNTAFLPLRLSFALLGRLNYSRRGILDDTHAFLFTQHSLKELMEECGYSIQSWKHIPPPYELAFGGGLVPRLLTSLHAFAAKLLPGLFAYQHLVEAAIRPTVSTLIRHSFENAKNLISPS
jgi:glycosyltransferase involved in cell wall biosynthesis